MEACSSLPICLNHISSIFVDDLIFFIEVTIDRIRTIMEILDTFSSSFRQRKIEYVLLKGF